MAAPRVLLEVSIVMMKKNYFGGAFDKEAPTFPEGVEDHHVSVYPRMTLRSDQRILE